MKNNLLLSTVFITLLLQFSTVNIFAQSATTDYRLILQNEKIWTPENFDDFLKNDDIQSDEIFDGKYHRILQFFQIPTNREKADLENLGIEFLDYFPNKAYITAIPISINKSDLKNKNIRSIIRMEALMKIDKSLNDLELSHSSVEGENVNVLLRFFKNIPIQLAEEKIRKTNAKILKEMPTSHSIKLQIGIDEINDFAALPFVSFIIIAPELGEPEDRRGRSLHRANMLSTEYNGGLNIDGTGVSVMVRDDGIVGPHIDFEGRNFHNLTVDGPINHADGVAGIFAGAGNLDPDMKGMASGSDMHVIAYFDDFEENLISLDMHQNEGVLVVNSSYSNGCNAGYTAITEIVDRHIFENPTFLHVFSAGNSNNQDCGYGAGNQWGNITGGHKQGKNVLATANVFENAELAGSSSRGPAHDGRIKPDITANGQNQNSTDPFDTYAPFGGTSGAAPGVAGVSAQLHQGYRDLNGGETATAALIKATIMNTANDLGNIGPDFKFGWGHLNANRAYQLLKDERYESSQISQNGNNMHTLNVPAGAVEVRVMVYWNEPSAMLGSGKALINDLDMVVTAPDGSTKMPWVLDETPDPTSLDLPATNGEDHLNNVEQVVFDNPVAGEYTIDVTGFEVPFGPQEYYVVYEVITDEITVTYPIGGEGFEPGTQERIRWDAYGDMGDFSLDYTTDGGSTWQNITTLGGDIRMYLWDLPNEIHGSVKLRVSRNGFSDESDETFSMCGIPDGLEVVAFCSDEFMEVTWNAVDGATGYDIFYLGEKFMDSVGTTNLTTFDVPITDPLSDHWFSVRAKGDNNLRGKRAIAVKYEGALLNCNLINDVATTQLLSPTSTAYALCDAFDLIVSIEVENTSSTDQTDLTLSYQIDNQSVVTENYNASTLAVGEVADYTFAMPAIFTNSGTYQLKTWSTIPNDEIGFNDTLIQTIIVSIGNTDVPDVTIVQGFEEDVFPPTNWFSSNPDGEIGWVKASGIVGATNEFDFAALVPNRVYEDIGQRDELFTVPYDLTNSDNPTLSFDLAYARFDNLCSDTLIIEIYTECGQVFQEEIYKKFGTELITGGTAGFNWFPNNQSDWRQEAISLLDYVGEIIQIRFINATGNCNNLLIDNVNILNFEAPIAEFTPDVTELCVGENMFFENTSTAALSSYSWLFGQGASSAVFIGPNPDSIFYFLAGEKEVRLVVTNDLGTDTFYQTINVLDLPIADFSVSQSGLGYQFTNESEQEDSYYWDFGDNTNSTEENPFKTYAQQGTYTVKLTVGNICDSEFTTETLNVMVTDVENITDQMQLQIVPNPNDGVFNLKIEDEIARDLAIQIFDVQGRGVGEWQTKSTSGVSFFPIEKSEWSAGVFFVKVKSDLGVRVLRMVVE
ncbi:MAG: S8 family serine peptidase [Saprospiraceae bacterium]